MMRTKHLILFLLSLLLLMTGCARNNEKTDGISVEYGEYSYRVEMNGVNIEDIFTLIGTPLYSHVTLFGSSGSGERGSTGVNYCKVAEGGWVAYNGSEFIYMPNETSKDGAALSSASLAFETEDVMTLEEFAEYFDFVVLN